ncbi:Domain of unknown function (DUF1152)-containing protein [uncultured virus]|nr:Domain of unknown function (DUF1152)-containing protein [uncultured virus]
MIGCGGGYDIYVGLPFYFTLIDKGLDVHLANFSFTSKENLSQFDNIGCDVYEVNSIPGMNQTAVFFPELHLSRHLLKPIYAIYYDGGVSRLKESYQVLINTINPDCIILVDGGCDSLMFGYEESMATWVEDAMSIYVANQLNIKCYLLVGGATSDFYEGIKESDLINNISILKSQVCNPAELDSNRDLRSQGHLIWETMLDEHEQPHTRKYIDIFMNSDPHFSIVNSCIVAAARGIRGKYCPSYLNSRIKNIMLTITDLTAKYWLFDLHGVAKNISYLALLDGMDDSDEIESSVSSWRASLGINNNLF